MLLTCPTENKAQIAVGASIFATSYGFVGVFAAMRFRFAPVVGATTSKRPLGGACVFPCSLTYKIWLAVLIGLSTKLLAVDRVFRSVALREIIQR